jgi:predicted ABC-type ATPase
MSNLPKGKRHTARLRIIAGPNGSGKSSYFYQLKNEVDTGVWINADDLNAELIQRGYIDFGAIGYSPKKRQWDSFIKLKRTILFISQFNLQVPVSLLQFGKFIISAGQKTDNNALAALLADFFRYALVKDVVKFTTETVFSHPSKIQMVKDAKSNGFRTYLYFICTESPELNIQRVRSRTLKGGHPVSAQKIVERYNKSLKVLIDSIPFFDRVFIFDNSGFEHSLILSISNGKVEKTYANYIPTWVKEVTKHL